jgi:hypothetical protein
MILRPGLSSYDILLTIRLQSGYSFYVNQMDTGFLLGGGFALLIALLGWSDQIRGAQEKTRTQEREFLQSYGFRWRELRKIVRSSEHHTAEDRLRAVLRVLTAGGLDRSDDVKLFQLIRDLDLTRSKLEKSYNVRYWTVFSACLEMLICGVLSIWFRDTICEGSKFMWMHLYLLLWAILTMAIVMLTFGISCHENNFRILLAETDDALRTANEDRGTKGDN